MPETIAYLYTTQAEMERLYGRKGLAELINDIGGANIAEWWIEIAADATTTIDAYASQVYNPVDLYTSRWVRTRATWIGCFRASQRKGNPDLFSQRYDEIIEELEKVRTQELIIPNLPTSSDLTPAMSNVFIDARYEIDKIRVLSSISTGGTSGRQSVAWQTVADWF